MLQWDEEQGINIMLLHLYVIISHWLAMGVTIYWTELVDWNTGLNYWTEIFLFFTQVVVRLAS